MQLIVAVEEAYKMRFKLSDVVKFKNVGDMCRVLQRAFRHARSTDTHTEATARTAILGHCQQRFAW